MGIVINHISLNGNVISTTGYKYPPAKLACVATHAYDTCHINCLRLLSDPRGLADMYTVDKVGNLFPIQFEKCPCNCGNLFIAYDVKFEY